MKRSKVSPAPEFRISSFCDGGACVGVAKTGEGVAVQATSQATKLTLEFTKAEWVAFVAGVKAGEFDL